jgi:hypothetical protein
MLRITGSAEEGKYTATDYELVDFYPHTEVDLWEEEAYGKTVYQSAPATMARNMPLPKVEVEGDAPYVMASAYPNGAVCVATEGRVKPEDQWYHPRAKVTIGVDDLNSPIGVFGHYDSLVLEFSASIEDVKHLWGQDLVFALSLIKMATLSKLKRPLANISI